MPTDSEADSPLPSSSPPTSRVSAADPPSNRTDNPYVPAVADADADLILLVRAYSQKKPCLRTVSYAFPKWPWLSNFILDDGMLADLVRANVHDMPNTVTVSHFGLRRTSRS